MYQRYFTQGLKTVVFSISLLFSPAILADNPKFDLTSNILHIPLVEVVLLNSDLVCYRADLGLMPDSSTLAFSLSSAAPVDCGNEQGCQNPGTPSYNECQTRRLQGTWSFTYTDGSTTTTRIYTLTDVRESSSGEYSIIGTNEEDEFVVALYDAEDEMFSLSDHISSTIARLFIFDLTSEDTVAGCFYLFKELQIASDCHDMTGNRTSGRIRAAKRVPIEAVQGIYEKSKLLRMELID
ncbi:hypothetical protein PN36_06055 [Candidatus Thiomargarita nelsonii]|uniref:Secreted protein n=1 Tax=Candidatus Thiomargarita nelsonii TaxID=1003181 RepID=A0A4E0RKG7_9GAMM|nr:hypothetical protein PN36_06055 [Candidatus Thiomargarita nelsonii]